MVNTNLPIFHALYVQVHGPSVNMNNWDVTLTTRFAFAAIRFNDLMDPLKKYLKKVN